MKKQIISVLTVSLVLLSLNGSYIIAQSFDGREQEMNKKCAVVYDAKTQQECIDYKAYLKEKASELDNQIASLEKETQKVKGKIEEVRALVAKNNEQIHGFDKEIADSNQNIKTLQASIEKLNAQVHEKAENIKERDRLMKERLIEMQPYIGSNKFIDFLMGASDFNDFLRRSSIVGELNAYEQEQIELVTKERTSLEKDKIEIEEKKEFLIVQQSSIEGKRKRSAALKQSNEELLKEYRAKDAEIAKERRLAQVASGKTAAAIPTISTDVLPPSFSDEEEKPSGDKPSPEKPNGGNQGPAISKSFVFPVIGTSYVSAGTWAYPGGGAHLGMDIGTYQQTGLSVVAPASGIVVAIFDGVANHPVYVDGTTLPDAQKWVGIPEGGGNTLHMITEVNGVAYGVSFFHLSPGMFRVSTGSIVSQGQVIAGSGHSGNTSGPHVHVEVINLGKVGIKGGMEVFYRYGKDYGYGMWDVSGQCAIKGSTPCLERPENFF